MSKLIATVYKERTLGLGSLPTVALEEQVQAIEEATALQQQIEGVFTETDRAAPMVSALEDLAFVVDRIKEITPKEAALIQVAGDFAVAGTDTAGEVITPSMESMIGENAISGSQVVQRIKDTVAHILAAIKQLIKQIMTYAASYVQRIMVIAGGSETRLKKLEKAFDEISASSATKDPKPVSVQLPTVNGKGVSTMQELIDESQKFAAVMKNFMDVAGDANYNFGSGFVRLYESDLARKFSDDNAPLRDGAVKLMGQISKSFDVGGLFRGQSYTQTTGQDGSIIGQTTQLIGGIRVVVEHMDPSVFTNTTLHSSTSVRELVGRVARKNSISVVNDAVSAAAMVEVEAMSYSEIEKAIRTVRTLLAFYSARSGNMSISAALQKRTAFARSCSDQIASAVKKMDPQNPVAYVLSLESLAVSDAITKNATLPYTRLSEAAGRTISYLLTAISKSIAAHAKSQNAAQREAEGPATSRAKTFAGAPVRA